MSIIPDKFVSKLILYGRTHTQRTQQGRISASTYRRAHSKPDNGAHIRMLALTHKPHRTQEKQVQLRPRLLPHRRADSCRGSQGERNYLAGLASGY